MGIRIQKILADLPKERREKIKATAKNYIREYQTLAELRKALGITQEMIANHQGVKQVNISNLEKRNDMLLSTLHRYVQSLGCKLEINILVSGKEVVQVKNING